MWCLPSFLRKYHTKPAYIVGWILDHEGVGSLLSYLKKKVWALNLTFSIDDKSFYSIFTVHILLTDDGLKNLSNVIESVFSYIKLMQNQGPQEIFLKKHKHFVTRNLSMLLKEMLILLCVNWFQICTFVHLKNI